jgi:hypothetical protein
MSDTVRQPSFARGELDPALHSRTDLDGYRTGLATLRNMVVMRAGGVQNRAGFEFLAPTKFATTSGSSVRLIPFVFNTDDGNTYAIEAGDLYFRFYKNGAQIRKTAVNISAITQANPGVITTGAAHGLLAGEEFYVSGIVGMKELNGRWFKAGTVGGGGTTVQLLDRDGNNINTSSYTAYVSGGTTEEVYELTTTYDEDDVFDLSFAQLNDTMIFAHKSYTPRKLIRTSDTSWTIENVRWGPMTSITSGDETGQVTATNTTVGAAGSNTYRYRVSCIAAGTGEEGLTGFSGTQAITGATQANPVQITANSHVMKNGDVVIFTSVGGMTELNVGLATRQKEFVVTNTATNTFDLLGINGTSFTAYSGSGFVLRTHSTATNCAAPTPSAPTVTTWTLPSGVTYDEVQKFAVYREVNGVYGFIGFSAGASFSDIGVTPDTGDTPNIYYNPFIGSGNYPSKVCFYQQRLIFANSTNNPNTIWASKIGRFYDFSVRDPQQDGDSIEFQMLGSRAMQIRSMIDLGRLIVFTTEGEYVINGDANGALTPFEINPRQISGNGSADLAAMIVNSSALYVQARASIVRDLIKTGVTVDGYDGDERSIWSDHLLRGYTVSDSAYQQVPDSIAWFVRSDGDMVAMTYVREQSMFGWSKHDTQGTFESICAIPEGTEDALYAVVSRTVNGSSVRYIERMQTRYIGPDDEDVEDNVFVDSSITFDGRNTGATTMTITTATTYVAGQTLTLTASASYFNADMVGDKINVTSATGDVMHLLITASTSATVMSVTCDETIPANLQNTARTTWGRARKTIPQLWHLEGLSVSCQGDSFVESNPNKSSLTTRTVASGSVAFGRWYEVLHIGLPYVSDLQTLDIETGDPFQNLTGKQKLIRYVLAHVNRSRGLHAGETLPSSDASTTGLREMIPLDGDQSYDETPELTTDLVEVPVPGTWNEGGRMVIRQVDPLPCSILAVSPRGEVIPRGGR